MVLGDFIEFLVEMTDDIADERGIIGLFRIEWMTSGFNGYC